MEKAERRRHDGPNAGRVDLRRGSPRHLGGVFGLEADEPQDAHGVVAVGVPGRLSVEHGAHDGPKRAAGRAQRDLLVGDLEIVPP